MKKPSVVLIAVVSAAIGALLVPRVVEAAVTASPVKIQDAKSTAKARVVNGYLRVDPNASFVTVYPFVVLKSGNGDGMASTKHDIFVSGVAADGALTLTADTDCNGSGGDTVWRSGNETSYSFTASVYVCGPLMVTNAAGVNWTIYGRGLGTSSALTTALEKATSALQRAIGTSSG